MAIFECKQGYTFRTLAKTEKEAMNILEKFYVRRTKFSIAHSAGSRLLVPPN